MMNTLQHRTVSPSLPQRRLATILMRAWVMGMVLGGAACSSDESAHADPRSGGEAARAGSESAASLESASMAAATADRPAEAAGPSASEPLDPEPLDPEPLDPEALDPDAAGPELRDLEFLVLMPGGEPATFVEVLLLDMERVDRTSLLRATGGDPDAEKLLEVLGTRKTTDSRGRVVFRASGGGLLASASLGRLFATRPFSPTAEGAEVLTLQLAVDSSVRARAVDADGAPMPGIPIALTMELPTPGANTPARWVDLAIREASGADATVRFRDPRGGVQSPGGKNMTRFGLRAAIPGLADPTPVLFDPDAPPEAPLDLTVPRLSSFVVEVLSPTGQRLDIEADVFVEAQNAPAGSKLRARLQDGRATFTAIVPKTLLRVTVQPLDGGAAFEGIGPGADLPGDVAMISVSMGGAVGRKGR
ncbi:hypothetical protein Poly30_09180 [Planctomycetes bacterium Poly30]|uniref:Uncharacterized protein n=1 Tax=Saltatorellus ferox TaxID=2528018 RepID=A0A518EMY2_9BACT|nr:hypothetical protein Poly30_09180 [Planctomycetes bacterium Poly30]